MSFRRVALLSCYYGISTTFVGAQQPTPTPAATPKPQQAFVRFWNMLPGKPSDTLELLAAENKTLTSDGPGNYYADYAAIAPGAYTFIVRRPTDPANPLKRLPLNLLAGASATIMVSMKDNHPVVETIVDTIDPKTAGSGGRIVLRQLVPEAQVSASVGNGPSSAILSYGDSAMLDNLPAAQVTINVQATFAKGPAKAWSVSADLTKDHHGTLLVMLDRYGRLRPQVTTDGPTEASKH